MTNIEGLEKRFPDLVEEMEKHNMTHEQLLERACGEILDLLAMQERVSVFMEYCTENLSKTNYTPDVIRMLVEQKQNNDISRYCQDLIESAGEDIPYLIDEIEKEAKKLND